MPPAALRAKLLPPEQKLHDFVWSSWPDNLKSPEQRPRWLRVDRLLGAQGIPKASAAGREQLEQYLETRRAQEDGEEFKGIRRGWCLGAETFRQELLERVRAGAGEHQRADVRREWLEEKARRILREELDALGWDGAALAIRVKLRRRIFAQYFGVYVFHNGRGNAVVWPSRRRRRCPNAPRPRSPDTGGSAG